MHVAIVIANGLGSFKAASVSDQNETFQDVGKTIAKWVADAGIECTIYVPQKIDVPASVTQVNYPDGRTLVNDLKLLSSLKKPLVLFVIGHGAQAGYVDLIDKPLSPSAVPLLYQIAAPDINVIDPSWYFGLHCYAGTLINNIDLGVKCYGIVGNEPAGSDNLHALISTPKYYEAFVNFLMYIVIADTVEAQSAINGWKKANQGKAFVR